MTVTLTITAADGATTTIPMSDPAISQSLPSSLSFQFQPSRGGMFQSNAGSGAASVANGDVIGYLPDYSGVGFNLTSVTDDATRPILGGIGVRPYVSFNGSNNVLRRLASSGAMAAGRSWFVAIRSSNPNIAASTLMAEGSSASNNPLYGLLSTHATTPSSAAAFLRSDLGGTPVPQNTAVLQAGVFDGSDHVYGVVDNGTSMTPYLDGVAGTPMPYTRSGTFTFNTFALGAFVRAATANFWPGRIYGAIGANRVFTAAEIAQTTANL